MFLGISECWHWGTLRSQLTQAEFASVAEISHKGGKRGGRLIGKESLLRCTAPADGHAVSSGVSFCSPGGSASVPHADQESLVVVLHSQIPARHTETQLLCQPSVAQAPGLRHITHSLFIGKLSAGRSHFGSVVNLNCVMCV